MHRIPSFLKWLASGLVGIALFTGLFLLKGNGRAVPLPPEVTASSSPSVASAPNKVDLRNLLVTVARDDQRIAGSVLVVANRNVTRVRVFTIEPRVVISAQGGAPTDLATAGFENASSRVQQGLEDASGVRIDGSLVLQRLALAGLVDSVRGIDVTNPKEIHVQAQEHRRFTIPRGRVHLDGSRAAAYALARVTKESHSAQAARLYSVLAATLGKLPRSQQRMKETLSSLGSLSRTTVPTGDVAGYLVRLNNKQVWSGASSTQLATVPSDLGGKTKSSWERFDLPKVVQQVGNFTTAAFTQYSKASIRVALASKYPADRLDAHRDFRNTEFVFVDGGKQISPKVTKVSVLTHVSAKTLVNLRKALGLKKIHCVYLSRSSAATLRGAETKRSRHPIANITVTLGVDYRALHNNKESVK